MSFTASKRALVPLVLICASATLSACSSNHNTTRYGSAHDAQSAGMYETAGYYQDASMYGGMYQQDMSQYGYQGGCGTAMPSCGNTMAYQQAPMADCGVTYPTCETTQLVEAMPEPIITPPIAEPVYVPSTPIECPAGTTMNPDGISCMEHSTTTYVSEPVFTPSAPIECPAGTTMNPDGMSCMETSYVAPSYPAPTYTPPVYLPARK